MGTFAFWGYVEGKGPAIPRGMVSVVHFIATSKCKNRKQVMIAQ